ncbi:MAG: DUF1080 domain-containing protein, partial [Candidatus Aminicenantes bacterium]|nr:DUF1080 domain-containing protein [Candidatus Aminicenantes bacterium]
MMRPRAPRYPLFLLVLAVGALFAGAGRDAPWPSALEGPANRLTVEERARGWVLLFDGATFAGWRGLGRDGVPEKHWVIEDGAIKKVPGGDVPLQADGQPIEGGDLMTVETFRDFELVFEWKIGPGGNSGVKYNVSEEMSIANPPRSAALGFEYQILDDERHPDAKNGPNRTAAALYDLVAPEGKRLEPVGEFNRARIVFAGGHGEHWLNGVKVLFYDLGAPRMNELLARSKYKDIAGFADKRDGHICLQDHTDAAWFRNIKIRRLKHSGDTRLNSPTARAGSDNAQSIELSRVSPGLSIERIFQGREFAPERFGPARWM